jgi:hypothetical protein
MVGTMQSYRLVFLDGEGRPQAYYSVVCSGEREAAGLAYATGYGGEIEIWDGERLVRRLETRSHYPEPQAGRRRPAVA